MQDQQKFEQSQKPKKHRPRFKLGHRRQAGTTVVKKMKKGVGLNEQILELAAQNKLLHQQLRRVSKELKEARTEADALRAENEFE